MAASMFNCMLSSSKIAVKTEIFRLPIRSYRPRKPMWKGRAKTKMFIIPEVRGLPKIEEDEYQRLKEHYETIFKSIREYCSREYYLKTMDTSDVSMKHQQEETEELALMLEQNRLENEQTAIMREERLKEEATREDNRLIERMLKMSELEKEQIEIANEEIRRKKELVKTLVTPDNLDATIEHALANPVDYNFAVSLDGAITHQQLSQNQISRQDSYEQAVSKQ